MLRSILTNHSRLMTTTAITTLTRRQLLSSRFISSSSSSSSSTSTPSSSTPSTFNPNKTSSHIDPLLSHLDPNSLPPTIQNSISSHKTLYQHLSTLPKDGVGSKVRQRRWITKGLDLPMGFVLNGRIQNQIQSDDSNGNGPWCYWTITRTKLKSDGKHGKAWGRLTWRGREVTPQGKEERIRGGLKYMWENAH